MTNFSSDIKNNYLEILTTTLAKAYSRPELYEAIVNTPFKDPLAATYLSLGIVVLLLVSSDGETIERVALSDTIHAEGATRTSEKNFHEITIPLSNTDNTIAKAIRTGTSQTTEDWKYLFTPALKTSSARFNQAGAGIDYSLVVPLKNKPHGGAMIFSFYANNVDSTVVHKIAEAYTKLVSAKLDSLAEER